MNLKKIFTASTILAVTLVLAGCGKSSQSNNAGNGKYAKTQTLNWTENSALATADISKATDTLSFDVLMNTQVRTVSPGQKWDS